jgi:hypothetical protein
MKVHTKYKYFNQYQIDKFFNTKANKIQTMVHKTLNRIIKTKHYEFH